MGLVLSAVVAGCDGTAGGPRAPVTDLIAALAQARVRSPILSATGLRDRLIPLAALPLLATSGDERISALPGNVAHIAGAAALEVEFTGGGTFRLLAARRSMPLAELLPGLPRHHSSTGLVGAVVEADGTFEFAVERAGVQGRASIEASFGLLGVPPPGAAPPRLEVRHGEQRLATAAAGADTVLPFPLAAGPGRQLLQLSVTGLAPGSRLVLFRLLVEEQDGRDRLLWQTDAPEAARVRYSPQVPAARVALLSRQDAAREVRRVLTVLPGACAVTCAPPRRVRVYWNGVEIEPATAPRAEVSWTSALDELGELLVVADEPLAADVEFVQPAALHLRLKPGQPAFEPVFESLRGDEGEGGHPLVRHVVRGAVARRSILLLPDTQIELPVTLAAGDVLAFSWLREAPLAEAAGATCRAELVSVTAGGAEHVLFRSAADGTGWRDERIPVPEAAAGGRLLLRAGLEGAARVRDRLQFVALATPRLEHAGARAGPGVLLYLVDTLRADHLSCQGYARATTPHLDRLAAEGIRFARAYSSAPWTRPSVATLLTGRHAAEHGVGRETGLAGGLVTLAEQLAAAGYRTAAFVANPHVTAAHLNFEQGFGWFEAVGAEGGGMRAADVHAAVERWLARPGAGPFLVYLHVIDPHAPYDPPAEAAGTFADPDYRGALRPELTPLRELHPFIRTHGLGAADRAHLVDLYDEEILATDRHLGALLQGLRDRGQYDDTLVVVLSDHGEEFGEHGGFGHGQRLFDEQLWVPLVLKPPRSPSGALRGGRVIDAPVSLRDLPANLMALLGRAWSGPGDRWDLDAPSLPGAEILAEEESPAPQRALIRDGLKLIERAAPAAASLFDLRTDPGEQQDLAGERPDQVRRLAARLRELLPAGRGPAAAPSALLSPQEREALRRLGYLGPAGEDAHDH